MWEFSGKLMATKDWGFDSLHSCQVDSGGAAKPLGKLTDPGLA
jgi:hypothetical protein